VVEVYANDTGNYSDNGSTGMWTFTSTSNSSFNLYGVGSYANGSFSFLTFSASLNADANTGYTETGHGGPWVSYTRTDNTDHSVNLTELGRGQSGNFTLTLSYSDSHSFVGILAHNGGTISNSGSNSITTTSTGTFSLAGGNPYFPPAGGVAQAAGAQVGVDPLVFQRWPGRRRCLWHPRRPGRGTQSGDGERGADRRGPVRARLEQRWQRKWQWQRRRQWWNWRRRVLEWQPAGHRPIVPTGAFGLGPALPG
jgi:hypothetical protein